MLSFSMCGEGKSCEHTNPYSFGMLNSRYNSERVITIAIKVYNYQMLNQFIPFPRHKIIFSFK